MNDFFLCTTCDHVYSIEYKDTEIIAPNCKECAKVLHGFYASYMED